MQSIFFSIVVTHKSLKFESMLFHLSVEREIGHTCLEFKKE